MNPKTGVLYQVILSDLRDEILTGKRRPHDTLPSENELSSRYNTTRATVRRSLAALEAEGLIRSWPGKGYFVEAPAHNSFTLTFSEDEPEDTVFYKGIHVIKADPHLQEIFQFPAGSRVIEICRTIQKKRVPAAYDIKYIPYEKGSPLIEREIDYAVFPEILAARTAPFSFYTKMKIGAELPSEQVARALHCDTAEPLLVVERIFMNKSKICIGYGRKYLRQEYGSLTAQSGYL